MKLIYEEHYNFQLGVFRYLHPFNGTKFREIFNAVKNCVGFIAPPHEVSSDVVDEFLSSIMRHRIRNKNGILRALEVPNIPFISFEFLDKRVLTPMRWGVAGTLLAAEKALEEQGLFWNLSGGYHHAMQQNMEGFCIYNDIGIAYQQLIKKGLLTPEDKILIIDTDAHHGNGNAYTFMENTSVTLLDIYNAGIYPTSNYTRIRVDISVPLPPGTEGPEYLRQLTTALDQIDGDFKLAFVVAGTDVLASDKLGGLALTVDDVATREQLTLTTLAKLNIPTVVVGGGGYSKESATAVSSAILKCVDIALQV